MHSSPGPRSCGRSYSLYRWERVGACPGLDPGVRVFRAATPGLRKGLSWRPAPAPARSPSFVGAGPKPASSARNASTPPPRHARALSVPGAAQPPPHSPNLRRQPARKTGPSYLSPARIPSGDSRWREIAPPSPPPNSRRPAQALSFVRSPQPPLAVPLRTPQPPAQPSPHRPGKASPTHARPRSARRRPCPGASPMQPKNAPPRLISCPNPPVPRPRLAARPLE